MNEIADKINLYFYDLFLKVLENKVQSKAFSTLLTYMTNRLFRPTFDEKIVRILFGCKKENSSALAVILFFLHCERKHRRWF